MNTDANFYYEITNGILVITDLDLSGHKSVTNDVQNVLKKIKAKGDLCSKVIYQDSSRYWDEIIVDSAMQFMGFRSLNEKDLGAALQRVRESVSA